MDNIPGVQLESGKVFGSVPTFWTQSSNANSQPTLWQNESLPNLDPLPTNDNQILKAMGTRLRHHAILHPAGDTKLFWPQHLLDHLLDKETLGQLVRVLVQRKCLLVYENSPVEDAEIYWTNRIWGSVQDKGFRRLLALLILVGRHDCMQSFIDRGLDDDGLPLKKNLDIFLDWDEAQVDLLYFYQWGFKVPFFASSKERGKACRVVLDKNDIAPWYQTASILQRPESSQTTTSRSIITAQLETMTLGGNFGEVSQIFIHPWQHDFHNSVKSVSYANLSTKQHMTYNLIAPVLISSNPLRSQASLFSEKEHF